MSERPSGRASACW